MANCKDCVHADMCRFYTEELAKAKGITLGKDIFEYFSSGDVCEDFKDCSRFVELPCKVGDKVYVIESIDGEEKIIQDHVETISIGYYDDGINIYQFDGIKTDGYFSDFGKTVFLTRKEAEQALKLKTGDTNA